MRACLKKQFLDDAFVPVGWLVFLSDISTTERACINPAACYDFPFGLISFKKKKSHCISAESLLTTFSCMLKFKKLFEAGVFPPLHFNTLMPQFSCVLGFTIQPLYTFAVLGLFIN